MISSSTNRKVAYGSKGSYMAPLVVSRGDLIIVVMDQFLDQKNDKICQFLDQEFDI